MQQTGYLPRSLPQSTKKCCVHDSLFFRQSHSCSFSHGMTSGYAGGKMIARSIHKVVGSGLQDVGKVYRRNVGWKKSIAARLSFTADEYPNKYLEYKNFVNGKFQIKKKLEPTQIFAENQTNFSEIKVFGFDYDYTLAEYSEEMETFIYGKALEILIDKYKYPTDLTDRQYKPGYFIRGLHYDIKSGLIMKIDDRHLVQLNTVYKGFTSLEEDEARSKLLAEHIPKKLMDESCFRGSRNLQQLTDIFSLPEMMLLANVVHHFAEKKYSYDPVSVFHAVEKAVRDVHTYGYLHEELSKKPDKYLQKGKLIALIDKLTSDGKKLFILTNSRFPSLHVGMTHMYGKNWREQFELVVVGANKPNFFETTDMPFNTLILSPEYPVSWVPLRELKRCQVYSGGCCSELMRLTKWNPREVIYFGDQIYADLQNANRSSGWYTGAVIRELEREIEVMNSKEFGENVVWVQTLEGLIEKVQNYGDADSRMHLKDWLIERRNAKMELKNVFNEQFGSVFRSSLQGTYFSARLRQVADIYTSSVMNLKEYGGDRIFFPVRNTHPHEKLVSFGYQHDGFDDFIEKLSREHPV